MEVFDETASIGDNAGELITNAEAEATLESLLEPTDDDRPSKKARLDDGTAETKEGEEEPPVATEGSTSQETKDPFVESPSDQEVTVTSNMPGGMTPQGNMFMMPPGGLPGVAAMNYQGLLMHSQLQGNHVPQPGAMNTQQMWMSHPVLAQALSLNFRQGGNSGIPANTSLQGLPQSGYAVQGSADANVTGRPPSALYMTCDNDSLSEYQCVVRKQIELFEARREDVESNAQGRNRPIVMGQVGIRCRHCTMLPPKHRARGAIYYPAKLHGLYQAAQNMASSHLCEHCQHVPTDIRAELVKLRDRKSSAGGGKKYWADGVRVLGVLEDTDGLRFGKR